VAILDILLNNVVQRCWLEPQDWMNLTQTCSAMNAACKRATFREKSCDGRKVQLFRWGMASSTVERLYLTLSYPNVSRSFHWKGNTTGETYWYKIRFHPETRMVHTGDYTFAKLSPQNTPRQRGRNVHTGGFNAHVPDLGDLAPPQMVHVGEHTPYATCLDGSGTGRRDLSQQQQPSQQPSEQQAVSIVDLRGTPFAVQSEFKHEGYQSTGSWTYSHDDQRVVLVGGGFFGWTVSRDYPGNADDRPGAWALKLKFAVKGPTAQI